MTVEELVALQRSTLAPLIKLTKEHPPNPGRGADLYWLDVALVVGGVIEVRFHYGFSPGGDYPRIGVVVDFDREHWVSLVGHGETPLVALQQALLDAEATCNRP